MPKEPVDLIPVPSVLLAHLLPIPLREQEAGQKQVAIPY